MPPSSSSIYYLLNMSESGVQDPEQVSFKLKMINTIEKMPQEVRDRFRALKVIMDEVDELDE